MFQQRRMARAASATALMVCGILCVLTCSAQDSADGFAARTYRTQGGIVLPYRIFVPARLAGETRRYPLVLWLHGSGGRGADNLKQITVGNRYGSHAWLQAKEAVFVVAPQCPEEDSWAGRDGLPRPYLRAAVELVQQLQRDYPIDSARIYIAGQSMGGVGTWAALNEWPNLFAAAVPVNGGAPAEIAARISRIPVWVFHGANDPVVSVEYSRTLVSALQKAGGSPRYTEYPGEGHLIFEKVFAEPELVGWVLQQRRSITVVKK